MMRGDHPGYLLAVAGAWFALVVAMAAIGVETLRMLGVL